MWLPVPSGEVPEPRPGSCVKDTRDLPDTGKFNQEPHYFKKIEFSRQKKSKFFAI